MVQIKSLMFWVVMQHEVIRYWRFRTTYQYNHQGSRWDWQVVVKPQCLTLCCVVTQKVEILPAMLSCVHEVMVWTLKSMIICSYVDFDQRVYLMVKGWNVSFVNQVKYYILWQKKVHVETIEARLSGNFIVCFLDVRRWVTISSSLHKALIHV
jgi:hypothetical protein